MAIQHIGSWSANANSVNITTPTAGDLIIVFSYRSTSTTAPTREGTYSALDTASPGGSANSATSGYKISAGTETSTGTWTNATNIVCMVFRGVNQSAPVGTHSMGSGNSTTVTYPARTLNVSDGTSWVAGLAGSKSATAGMDGTTTALTQNRTRQTTVNGLDTNAGVTSFDAQTLSTTSGARFIAQTVEILAVPIVTGTLPIAGATEAASTGLRTLFGTLPVSGAASAQATGIKDVYGTLPVSAATGAEATGTKTSVVTGTLPIAAEASAEATGINYELVSGTLPISATADAEATGHVILPGLYGVVAIGAVSDAQATGTAVRGTSLVISASAGAEATGLRTAGATLSISAQAAGEATGARTVTGSLSIAASATATASGASGGTATAEMAYTVEDEGYSFVSVEAALSFTFSDEQHQIEVNE